NWRLPNSSDRANGPGYIRAIALALIGSSPGLAGIINSTGMDCDDEFPARMPHLVAGGYDCGKPFLGVRIRPVSGAGRERSPCRIFVLGYLRRCLPWGMA